MQEGAGVVDRSGYSIHYWRAGPQRAPMVVLTPGAFSDHHMFASQMDVLWSAGYQTLRWDVHDRGRTGVRGRSGKVSLTARGSAADLLALVDGLSGVRQLCLVGHAFGGYVVQEAVFQRPERVAALIVVGADCLTLPRMPWESWAARLAPVRSGLRSAGRTRNLIARAAGIAPVVQTAVYEAVEHFDKRALTMVARAMAGAAHPEPVYRIEQPLLLVRGQYDRTSGLARAAPRWVARDPLCGYEVVGRAGLFANQDNPKAFNQILLGFLATRLPVPRSV